MHPLPRAIVVAIVALALVACGFSFPVSAVPPATPAPGAPPTLLAHAPTTIRQVSPTAVPAPPSGRPSIARPTRPPTPEPTSAPLAPTPTLVPLDAEMRERVFEHVWETVRDHYLYPDFRGVDWEVTREEFAPKAMAATTPEEFYGLMRQMIARLGDDHSRFESPQDVAEQEAEFAGKLRYGGIGAEIRDVAEGGMVSSVVPGGPAAKAGINPRDLITAIDGIPYRDHAAFGPDGPVGRVRGKPGTRVWLRVKSPGRDAREVLLVREVIDLDTFNRVSAQRLAGSSVGLITIPSFYVESVDTHVRQAVEGLLAAGPLTGLVIDVRANSGGYVHLMRNTIALFHNGGVIGSTSGRSESEDQRIPEGKLIPGMADVPLTILIGPETVSAAEMFAAGMQVLGRAKVVGMPSAGNTENLYTYDFEDGSRVLLAEVAYTLPDGTMIEGRGVIPDRTLDAEWWRYAPDNDPQIIAAIEVMRAQ
ncbi:MAG: S41 family peptidase [Chloroflexales bacterium]